MDNLLEEFNNLKTITPEEEWVILLKTLKEFKENKGDLHKTYLLFKRYKTGFVDYLHDDEYKYATNIKRGCYKYLKLYQLNPNNPKLNKIALLTLKSIKLSISDAISF
jgi:hypothetical protein